MNQLTRSIPALALLSVFIFVFVTTSAAQPADCEKGFKTLVFGDSILWGEGLQDEDKFVNIVGRWLQARVGAPCLPVMHAHAGATIEEPGQNNGILAKLKDEDSLKFTPKDGESLLRDNFGM